MARDFDGTGDWLNAGDPSALNITTGNFTLAAWVNLDNAPPPGYSSGIVTRATDSGVGVDRLLALEIADGGTKLRLELYDGSNNPFVTDSTNLGGTGWRHVAGVRDSGTLRIYVDGAEVNNTADTAGDLSGGATQTWRIGGRADAFGKEIDGRIAEVGIWTVALTAGEVAALGRKVMTDHVRPLSMVSYAPCWGRHSPEIDLKTPSITWTLAGTSAAATHAPVVPFSRRFWVPMPIIPVATGGLRYVNPLDGLGNYYRGGAG